MFHRFQLQIIEGVSAFDKFCLVCGNSQKIAAKTHCYKPSLDEGDYKLEA